VEKGLAAALRESGDAINAKAGFGYPREAMDDTGQITSSAAEFYEAFFVPALFEEWTSRVVAAAGLRPPMEVLDVA
jgi:hypothetical protein